jgi:hypothetical protein
MLVLAPYADYSAETAAKRITRSQCLNLNEYSADLANVTLKGDGGDKDKGNSALKCDEQDKED